MKIQSLNLLLTLLLTAPTIATAETGNRAPTAAPFGTYQVVALRNASDVAAIADPEAGSEWLNQSVNFGEQQSSWFGGGSCVLWSVRETESPLMSLEDPNLSDVTIGPLESGTSSGDMRVNVPVELVCQDNGEEILGNFVIIDARVLIASFSPFTVNLILELPLTEKQTSKFQAQLKDMKFYDGELTGVLDEATVTSIGFYAEYRGSEYRFFRTAITENLLDGLNVLDETE